ncbi:hypothetical protein LZ554_000948 [Drepanopeziza brunnea f. sp. 'monogermtubi']|nr:hypothetical protein LZ554_000948 [Drepanopeziza brunnea f. sp. 'monogermtubi']
MPYGVRKESPPYTQQHRQQATFVLHEPQPKPFDILLHIAVPAEVTQWPAGLLVGWAVRQSTVMTAMTAMQLISSSSPLISDKAAF